jgi:hypothetical protein
MVKRQRKVHVLWSLLFALCSLFFYFSLGYAEGLSGLINLNYTDMKQFEEGEKAESSDNLFQNYYFRLDKSITPMLSYQLNIRSTLLNFSMTDAQGDTTKSYQRAIEPDLEVFLRNPVYALDAGYRRLEQWSTAHLSDEGRRTRDYYYSRFTVTPRALPSMSLQFDRQKDHDHLPVSKLDTTDTKYSANSWYDLLYKDVKFSYNATYTHERTEAPNAVISKITSDNFNGSYNFNYNKSLMGGAINLLAGYQGNYFRNKTVEYSTQSGSISVKRTPSLGMYGLGTQLEPEVDTLTSAATLTDNIYDVPATTATGTINIGQNGKKYSNIGIQLFSSSKPVDTIFIYVNKDATSDTNLVSVAGWKAFRSDFNLPSTWTEIIIQNVTLSEYDPLNKVFRYEIKLSAPQSNLFFKVVNMEVASVSDVFVTEIEAYGTDVVPSSGKTTDISTFFAQGINFTANVRPAPRLTFTLNYFLNRSDQDPRSIFTSVVGAFSNIFTKSVSGNGDTFNSNVTRTLGVSSTWLTHRLLTTTVRFDRNQAFDNRNETDISSNTYQLAFHSSPLPTLDANLSFVRTYTYNFDKKDYVNSLYLLTVGSKLYRGVNMITDIGYTAVKQYADQSSEQSAGESTESSTRYVRGTLDAQLSPRVSANLTYGLSRTSGDTSSRSDDASLIMTYRPGRFFSVSGNFGITSSDDETASVEGILIDWLFLPAIRMNMNYQHMNKEKERTDSFTGYVIWYVTKFLDFQLSYGYLRDVKETRSETYSIGGNVICRLW